MTQKWSRAGVALAALVIAVYFIFFTAGSLRAEYTHDDLMNCYRGWFRPLKALVADNLLFWRFSPTYRPFPALIYKAFFGPFGFNFVPMRLFLWLILGANAVLAYFFVKRVTESREAGLLGALLICYHPNFSPLYYNTGTIYDIFCYFWYLFGLVLYLFWRRSGRYPGPLALVVLALVYILALDSKELAVSFPVTILAHELLFHPPTLGGLGGWLVKEARAVWLTGFVTLGFVLGRMTGPESISAQGGYRMTLSAAEYLKQASSYFGELFYANLRFTELKTLAVLLGLLGVAVLLRSRTLVFGWVTFTFGFLPIAFIPARSLNAAYLPLAGLALYFAALLVELRERLFRLRHLAPLRQAGPALLFLGLVWFLVRLHPANELTYGLWLKEYGQIRGVREQYAQIYPSMKPGARVLILKDPFGQYEWASVFLIHLLYRDQSIHVDQLAKMDPKPDANAVKTYDHIVTFEDGKLIEIDPLYAASARLE